MGAIQQEQVFQGSGLMGTGVGVIGSSPSWWLEKWKMSWYPGRWRDPTDCMCMCSLYVPESVCVNKIFPSVLFWTCVFCWDAVFCWGCSSAGAGAGVQRWKTLASSDHSPYWSVKVLADACKPLKCWSSKCSCLLSQPGRGGLSGHKLVTTRA